MKLTTAFLVSSAIAWGSAAHAAGPNVVVSVKPIHSLAAAIMAGVGEPALIVDGGASPHTYALKPSNASSLEQADVIFWVGHGLEAFLAKPIESLGSNAVAVELSEAPGLEKLKFREGGAFEAHDDGDEHGADETHADHAEAGAEGHGGHDHDETDMHLWLDPTNAAAMAKEIAVTLEKVDPENAVRYRANLAKLDARLTALDATIRQTIAPVKEKPFIVFHDAYQYFEHRYAVHVAGSITVSPETMPGAERLSQIHAKVAALDATCVFAEPQFEPKLVRVVLEGTKAKSGVLDPEGATLTAGPELYFDLMTGIATSLKTCLSEAS